jgi:hypothetical protein
LPRRNLHGFDVELEARSSSGLTFQLLVSPENIADALAFGVGLHMAAYEGLHCGERRARFPALKMQDTEAAKPGLDHFIVLSRVNLVGWPRVMLSLWLMLFAQEGALR